MDSIDRDILKYMSKRENYNELKTTITKSLCVKESWSMLTDFGEYFNQYPHIQEIDDDFKMWQRVQRHPTWKPEEASHSSVLVSEILLHTLPNRSVFLDNLYHLRSTCFYEQIATDLERGSIATSDADIKVRRFIQSSPIEEVLTDFSLSKLETMRTDGFYWRLEDLNQSLGPVDKGDFIVVVKRPEVGGTSFILSEMTYMLEQTNGNAILFNNEEAPSKVYSRMVSAALNVDYRTLVGDAARYDIDYKKWLKGSAFDLVHDTNMTISSLHKQLENKQYDLIGINVLLKVGGTGKAEDHDKFQELGEECRRISQQYGPVIAIVQADPTAEGMQYIPQDRIYKSKTALQGEADALIMIGTDEVIEDDTRYIHVAKNKLPPAACADIKCKHIKSMVKFNMNTGRFSSKNFIGNSRKTK